MIKLDESYSDYTKTDDPKYPGGMAIDASDVDGFDGTPFLANFVNDIYGTRQALFVEAFGKISEISGKPDDVTDSDVLKAIKKITQKYTDDEIKKEAKLREDNDKAVLKAAKEFFTGILIKYFMSHRWVQGAPYEIDGVQKTLPKPSEVFNFPDYRWIEIPRDGRFERGVGGTALPYGEGSQEDAMRVLEGYTGMQNCLGYGNSANVTKLFKDIYDASVVSGLLESEARIGTTHAHQRFSNVGIVPTDVDGYPKNDSVRYWILEKL